MERMNRNLFDKLIRQKLRLDAGTVTDYLRGIRNNMQRKNYTAAGAMLETAVQRFPRNDDLLILRIQYLADLQRGEELQALLKELDEKNVYLTAKAKEVIAFWKN